MPPYPRGHFASLADTTNDGVTSDSLVANGGDYDFGGPQFVQLEAAYEKAALTFFAGPLGGVITGAAYPNIVNTRAIQNG